MNTQSQAAFVMLVDDDPNIRALLREFLEDLGYRVAAWAHGQEALDHLRTGVRPCVILLDLMMPVMDGPSFLRVQKAEPTLAQIPVVVITAAGRAAAGALPDNEVLHKPFRIDAVLAAIEKHCGGPCAGQAGDAPGGSR